MKQVILCLLLLSSKLLSFGQGIDNIWMMGYNNAGGGFNFDFRTGVRTINMAPRQMNFTTTSLTYCDMVGNVLFYSNGVYIANALGDTMMNGSGLSPSYYTDVVGWNGLFVPQASLAIPWPDSPSKYILFHNTVDDSVAYSYRTYYSEIDMSLDGGLGAVTGKNNVLYSDTLMYGHLTGVKHANGRDWWVVFHGGKNDKYFIYLVDPAGIHLHAIQQIGGTLYSQQGQVCFSPDGSKYALYDDLNDLHLLDFDRCTGIFSNHLYVAINDSAHAGGVAFSANSQVLYVSSTKYVYQFDVTSSNIPSTQTTVAIWDTFYSPNPPAATTFYLAQLAPDNKIYISSSNGVLSMHVIEYPDSLGLSCNVCQHCITLPAYNFTTIPNHPNYHLGALGSSICDSLATGIEMIASSNQDEYTLFPNPVRDKMYLSSANSIAPEEVIIYNSLLQRLSVPLLRINNGEYMEVNTSMLLPGVYFLEIVSKDGKVVKRFVRH
ncbi:MAG TPA: T9SS type A sorting domain-containing protein [Bacteroidia bacterium]|nr:T9SS type A sorting domain-containing protein [Bacteroidia bacterium]